MGAIKFVKYCTISQYEKGNIVIQEECKAAALLPRNKFVLGNKEAGYRTEGQGGVGAGPYTIIDLK